MMGMAEACNEHIFLVPEWRRGNAIFRNRLSGRVRLVLNLERVRSSRCAASWRKKQEHRGCAFLFPIYGAGNAPRLDPLCHQNTHPNISFYCDLRGDTIRNMAACGGAAIFGARCVRKEQGGNPQIEGLNQGKRREPEIPKSNFEFRV
jgi:hypothetical protein